MTAHKIRRGEQLVPAFRVAEVRRATAVRKIRTRSHETAFGIRVRLGTVNDFLRGEMRLDRRIPARMGARQVRFAVEDFVAGGAEYATIGKIGQAEFQTSLKSPAKEALSGRKNSYVVP